MHTGTGTKQSVGTKSSVLHCRLQVCTQNMSSVSRTGSVHNNQYRNCKSTRSNTSFTHYTSQALYIGLQYTIMCSHHHFHFYIQRENHVCGESQKSANSLAHFSDDEMCSGSSSYVSKLLGSPGPFDFGKNGASTCHIVITWQHIIGTDGQ